MTNVFNSFWSWLQAGLSWFLPDFLMSDVLISELILPVLLMIFGCWLFFILMMKPIIMLMGVLHDKIYK